MTPPTWMPIAALVVIVISSAVRLLQVQGGDSRVKAYSFGHMSGVQGAAEGFWRVVVLMFVATSIITWIAPDLELLLGPPPGSWSNSLRWLATAMFAACVVLIVIAQVQMGASWRIGVPKEGPGALVSHGVFGWSRNPIFLGMVGASVALFLWTPNILSAAVAMAAWLLASIQIRIEEEALLAKHGEAYRSYAGRVGRWFGRRSERTEGSAT